MKKLLLFLFYWSLYLNLPSSDVDKFDNYFNSEIEFQLLKEYKNIFSNSTPISFYRTKNDEYIEFVGIYELDAYNEIYNNFIKNFENEEGSKESEVWFKKENQRGVIRVGDNQTWVKYLKKKN